jgi:PAS domain S-box-containing protein
VSTQDSSVQDFNKRLLELVHSISVADELQEALAILLQEARTLIPCDGLAFMLLAGAHLNVLASSGSTAPMTGLTLPIGQMGIAQAVIDSHRGLVVADTVEDDRWEPVPGAEKARSWLGAPFVVTGRPIGLLEWSDRTAGRFDDDDLATAEQASSFLAPVVHRIQLLDDTRSSLREAVEPRLDAFPRSADIGTELRPVVEEALDFTGAQHAFAFIQSDSHSPLRCVVAVGPQSRRMMRTRLRGDGTLGGWRIATAGSQDWLGAGPPDREVMGSLGVERTLLLPLHAGKKEVGMLGVAEPRRGRYFGRDATRLMTYLASQASVIVERIYPSIRNGSRYDYGMVVRSSPLGIGVVTFTGDIRLSNPAFSGLLSRPERSLEGHNLADFLVPEDSRRLDLALQEVSVTGQRQQVDARAQSSSGDHRQVRISLAPAHISDDAGGNVVVLMEDVTSLKILEQERVAHLQELREQHAKLKELDQLKSRFVSNVSHELRTPLAVIKLYATLSRKGRPEKRNYYLQTIEQETHRLETMVENILDLSRMDRKALRVNPEWLQPEDIINQVVEVYSESAQKKGIELRNQVLNELPLLWADKNHLVQMLTNLVGNALEYTPRGGQIWVAAREVTADDEPVLHIAVGDSGVGIAPEEQDKVFDRFFRGSNNTPGSTGTGLGLAIVRELMTRHGGKVSLESEVGQGSVFTLEFPLLEDERLPETLNEVTEP